MIRQATGSCCVPLSVTCSDGDRAPLGNPSRPPRDAASTPDEADLGHSWILAWNIEALDRSFR